MQRLAATARWLVGGVLLATVLAMLAPLGWPFELFSHFRVQYLAAGLLLAAWLAWRRDAAPAVLALALAGWNALPLLAAAGVPDEADGCNGPAFTIATANLQFSNERREAVRAWLESQPADLLVLQEVDEAWAADLAGHAAYPHRHLIVREDPYGLAVLSRWPLEDLALLDLADDGLPSLTGILDVGGRRVRWLGMHTHWPVVPQLATARDVALQRAAEIAAGSALPVVLLGDLNTTPDSPAFAMLLKRGALRDALYGRGWQPTWLAGFWPLALRIDHVLVSPGLCVEHAQVGPPTGSDHRPVVARLRVGSR